MKTRHTRVMQKSQAPKASCVLKKIFPSHLPLLSVLIVLPAVTLVALWQTQYGDSDEVAASPPSVAVPTLSSPDDLSTTSRLKQSALSAPEPVKASANEMSARFDALVNAVRAAQVADKQWEALFQTSLCAVRQDDDSRKVFQEMLGIVMSDPDLASQLKESLMTWSGGMESDKLSALQNMENSCETSFHGEK